MPTYDRIEAHERWDVVNYVRGLQGKLGRAVDTTAAGKPGETGRTVPGFTESAPTRPSPYWSPRSSGAAELHRGGGDTARAAAASATPGGRP